MSNLKTWWQSRTLHSADAETRLKAIEKLAASRDAQATAALLEALKDPEPAVRTIAAAALGERTEPRAVEPFLKLVLTEKDPEALEVVTVALALYSTARTVPPLLRALEDPDAAVRHNAASVLHRVGWETLEPVDRARVAIVQNAFDEVVTCGQAAIEPLAALFRDGTAHFKREAAVALGAIQHPRAIRIFMEVLTNVRASRPDRELAAWAMRKFFGEELDDLQWGHVVVMEGAWSEVGALGEAAIEPLRLALRDPDHAVRRRAAETFGTIHSPQVVAPLAIALSDPQQDVEVREIVAKLLGKVGGPAVVEALIKALGDEGWKVREAAAASLREANWQPGSNVQRAALAVVERRWDDVVAIGAAGVLPCADAIVYARVGFDAARTLVRMGTAGIDVLVKVLRDPEQPSTVRELVATVLAEVGDRRAIEPMLNMLSDPDMATRQTAVWTLEKLGWQPTDETQRAAAAIAREDWDGLALCGASAVEPLLNMLTAGMAPEESFTALRTVLEKHASRLSIKQLRAIMALRDAGSAAASRSSGSLPKVQQLARFELIRRGITV